MSSTDALPGGIVHGTATWSYPSQYDKRTYTVSGLISQLNGGAKNIDQKVAIIIELSRIGTYAANDAIIKLSLGACKDKLQWACVDAISKMNYELARINLQRIRDQFGPLVIDMPKEIRRHASLLLLNLDVARFRKAAKGDNTKPRDAINDLGLTRHYTIERAAEELGEVEGKTRPVDLYDKTMVVDRSMESIKKALFLLGRLSSEQADRNCVVRALKVLRNDHPAYHGVTGSKIDDQTFNLIEAELKRLY